MAEEILHNSPALHALKRHQLVSLSKRYGLRASGKNVEMIDRLKEYASNLLPSRQLSVPLPEATPARGLTDFAIDSSSASTPMAPYMPEPLPGAWFASERQPRVSDAWEVLSESGASLISPEKRGMTKSGSVNSWKSAKNGESLSEFGADEANVGSSRSKSSSIRAIAISLSRRASKHLMARSVSASSNLDINDADMPAEPAEDLEMVPPSPASTVGIPRRHSTISLLERPSTIRLVSPPPFTPAPIVQEVDDDLPFVDTETTQKLKERRSMMPLRSTYGVPSNTLSRRSMPAISAGFPVSASVNSIYPPLPRAHDVPPVPPIPGAYKFSTSPTKAFDFSISSTQFADAGQKVLAEMEARMKASMGDRAPAFGLELLKGKKAELTKLVSVREGLGEGGWGLSSSTATAPDRYAEAHQREFSRMQSINIKAKSSTMSRAKLASSTSTISLANAATQTPGKRKLSGNSAAPSAPNGLPLIPSEEGRDTKRKRLSAGPNALGSLREAGRSIANLLGEGHSKTPLSARKRARPSGTPGKGRMLASRFGLFRAKRRESLSRTAKKSIKLGEATGPGKTPGVALTASSLGTAVRPAEVPGPTNRAPMQPQERKSGVSDPTFSLRSGSIESRIPKARSKSTSAQSILSSSSKIRPRARIPEFAPPPPLPRTGSISTLPSLRTSSLASSMRKQSQSDLIRNARPAPPPPALSASTSSKIGTDVASSLTKRSSTLYMPTASSLARMQATVKPSGERPLPAPPGTQARALSSSTNKPFGTASASTKGNVLESTKMPTLASHKSVVSLKSAVRPSARSSPLRSPAKITSSAAARHRAKASGLSAVKSKSNLRGDVDVAKRREEIRAKQERLGEERELRELLGGDMNVGL